MRDADYQRSAPSCNNHGGCGFCEGNRLYQQRKAISGADASDPDEALANAADDAFDEWEWQKIEAIFEIENDADGHYPITSRPTPEYTNLLRRKP